MKVKPLHVALGLAAVGTGVYLYRRSSTPTRKADCSGVTTTGGQVDGVRYIEHVTGNASPDEPLPMLIVFHSLTATPKGTAAFKFLPPTRVIRPYGPYRRGNGYSWFTARSGASDNELAVAMANTARKVAPFLRDIALCRPTVGRPVVTGSSQGGMMAYLMASTAPSSVQGAVGVSGRLPEPLWNRKMAPTVGVHGTRDKTVEYAKAKAFADAMGFPFYSFDAAHEVTSAMSNKWIAEVKKMLRYEVA